MSGFDIESLLEFQPARTWCDKCLALWEEFAWKSWDDAPIFDFPWEVLDKRDYKAFFLDEERRVLTCKVCAAKYIVSEHYRLDRIKEFIRTCSNLPLHNIDNIVEHGRRLASIAREMRQEKNSYPPMRALFMAMNQARSFIHFISWGISPFIIGALKLAAQRVPVRGIVSNPGEQIMCEVQDFKDEAPQLEIKFCESQSFRGPNTPHQKLIVIDGLLAFKGSANLTHAGWRGAAKDKDIIEVVSNTDEVIQLHNRFFSSMWGKMNDFWREYHPNDEINIC